MVQREDGSRPVLTEVLAEDEVQLQELVKENPDLLPIEEFGMVGPLMVVGSETTLPSGYVDLACLSRGGDLLLIEFKTGPQNSDFRHVLAQLLDYGSDLWRMSYEEFESTVANRYFSGDRCYDVRLRGKTSLEEAAREIWPGPSEEERTLFRERLTEQLTTGAFHYVVVAQRFTPTMERTVEYLSATMSAASFYAVELVRFAADGISAFESRTILRPESHKPGSKRAVATNEAHFLEQIEDDTYREALQELLEVCHGLGLQLPWGSAGTSIRLQAPVLEKPLSIAWLFPPTVSGWMGLTDLTIGFSTHQKLPSPLASALEDYVAKVEALPSVEPAKPDWLRGYHLSPDTTVRNRHQIADTLAELVRRVGEET